MMETDIAVGSGLKVTCDRDELVAELGDRLPRRLDPRRGAGALAASCCAPDGGVLELAATDMELSLRTTLAGEVEGDGAVVVPGQAARRPRAAAARDARSRSSTGRRTASLTSRSGATRSKLNVYAAEDFPRLPAVDVAAAHDRRRRRCSRRSTRRARRVA